MDTDDFEFPPDQIDEDFSVQPLASEIPLSVLVSKPIEELPPTSVPGGATLSLRQTIRGVTSRLQRARQGGAAEESVVGGRRSPVFAATLGDDGDNGHDAVDDEFALESPALVPGGDSADEAVRPPTSTTGRLGNVQRTRAGWTEAEVHQFYTALSQYGTDFAAIAILFPNHTREEVKRLYHRELRRHQNQVRQALANKQTIDLDAFSTLLREKEKKERKPTKALNTEEEEMLSRIALSAASPSPSGDNATANDDGDEAPAGKRKKVAKRSRDSPPTPQGSPQARSQPDWIDVLPENGEHEKSFYEIMLDAETAKDRTKGKQAGNELTLAESFLANEFDFDEVDAEDFS